MSWGGTDSRRAVLCLGVALALVAFPAVAQGATVQVETTADVVAMDGDCSLREAVDTINTNLHADCPDTSMDGFGTNDTILVPAGNYNLMIAGTNDDANADGDLDIGRDVTITGTGNPVIDQNIANERVIDVPAVGDSLTLNGLTVRDGNVAAADNRGGNIRFLGDGMDQLTLNDVEVLNGTVNNAAMGSFGGGIYSTSPVTIQSGSLIKDNQAGGSANFAGSGGGLFMGITAATLNVSNSEISSNDAGFAGGAGTQGFGGGITFGTNGTTTINLTNATIDSNRASGGGSAGAGTGGGVYVNTNGNVTLTISGGSISSNEAGGGAGGMSPNLPTGLGGGLYFSPGAAAGATLDGVQVMGNKAGGNGGRADGLGGGIFSNGNLGIDDSNVSGNTAGFNAGGGGAPDLGGDGGGIHMGFGAPVTLTITDSTINLNRAGENQGNGGGIDVESTGNISISDSTIAGNIAGETTGGGTGAGGGVSRLATMGAPNDSILRTTISGNSAAGTGTLVPMGGGLHFTSQGTLTVNASTISGNTANTGNGTAVGGGLMLNSSNTTIGTYAITNSTISGNTATGAAGGRGGGIGTGVPLVGMQPPPNVTITHSTLAGNTANTTGSGGLGGNLYSGDPDPNPDTDLVDLRASILAYGTGDAGSENCDSQDATTFQSLGESVESTTPTQCELDGMTGDQIGVDPLLTALTPANGGDPANGIPTAIRMPMAGSPAINSVDMGCPPPATDQRGTARPQPAGGVCDAGAVEVPDTDGDGILDTADSCPTQAGPASNGGCPLPVTVQPLVPAAGENPECAALRAKLRKAKTRKKRKKLRARLRKLGC